MPNWTLITGASEGLGAEFARIAAQEGHNLILTARSEDKLNALAAEISDKAGDIIILPADLNDPSQTEKLWQEASDTRQIDFLVNNAGLGSHGDFADPGNWPREQSTINVNIGALTRLMKLAIAHMRPHGDGRIMNVASVAGFTPGPNMAVYHATKAYVLSLSEAVAQELAGSGITITALCPGATATEFFNAADMNDIGLLKLRQPMSAKAVAEAGWKAMLSGRRVIVPGLINKLFAVAPRFSPRWLTAYILSKIMGKY